MSDPRPIAQRTRTTSRREFIRTTAALGAGVWIAPSLAWSPRRRWLNEEIQFACIGVGGKGDSDSNDAGAHGRIVAICDIDENNLNKKGAQFPDAKKFLDFREMFESMGDAIDAVTVSTPDHTHAAAAVQAMSRGKHCFCQKPLTHSLYEARLMGELARKNNLATQMGNQGTASGGLRKSAAIIRSGALGRIREVHVWTNRPVWPQGCERPPAREALAHVHWDLWIGPAPMRPDGVWTEKRGWGPLDAYHPFNWRGWWDFGTGALGDMACHTMNMPFMGLDLREPVSVEAEHSGHNRDSYPTWSKIRYEFAARGERPALTLHWYDGGQLPPAELLNGNEIQSSGALVIGENGSLYSPGDNGGEMILIGIEEPEGIEFEHTPGHFAEFARAIETGNQKPAVSNFADYASPLTETVLLGNLAVWAGEKVEWDAKNLRAKNVTGLEDLIKHEYREGWTL